MNWMRGPFNPYPKHLTLTNVKANPEIQSLSKNPHVSNPAGDTLLPSCIVCKHQNCIIISDRGMALKNN